MHNQLLFHPSPPSLSPLFKKKCYKGVPWWHPCRAHSVSLLPAKVTYMWTSHDLSAYQYNSKSFYQGVQWRQTYQLQSVHQLYSYLLHIDKHNSTFLHSSKHLHLGVMWCHRKGIVQFWAVVGCIITNTIQWHSTWWELDHGTSLTLNPVTSVNNQVFCLMGNQDLEKEIKKKSSIQLWLSQE